ncbi:MAG: type II secretion system F family protein [Planctomycetota bacterium]|nr:type II secretion system F family protein [Planctomycetota bacterium]
MALFRYVALDAHGRTVKGTADAGTPAEIRAALRSQGLHTTRLEPFVRTTSRGPVHLPDWLASGGRQLDRLAAFSRQLAMLLKAGLPLAQALDVLGRQLEERCLRELAQDLAVRVREGDSLDAALAAHPRAFPKLFVAVARAGAASGQLGPVLSTMAAFYTRKKRLRDKVVSALTYPALMCGIGFLVLAFLMAFVVPKVTAVLLEQQRVLPWPTEVLLALSGLIQDYWWALLLGMGWLGWIFSVLLRSERGRRGLDRILLAVPVIGELLRKQAIAHWADTMSHLLASGLPAAQALSIAHEALGNRVLAADLSQLERRILEGQSLSEALKASAFLPPAVGFAAGVGEESGDLAGVLREIAEGYHEEVGLVAGRLTDLVNPILIVVLGLLVGFIVAAILLPITDFSQVQ